MSVTPITSGLVLKQAEFVEESVYGVMPTNPVFSWIGLGFLDYQADMGIIPVFHLQEDVKYLVKGPEAYSINFDYYMQNSSFAKYGVNPVGGGSGSIDKSLSILTSAKLGGSSSGTETFIQVNGVKANSITFNGRVGKHTRVTWQGYGKNLPIPSTSSPIGSGSYAADPNTPPWNYWDGGSNPITIGSASPDVQEISVTIGRQLDRIYHVGETKQRFLLPRARLVNGRITILWQDTSQYSNLANSSPVTISWILKSGTSTLTLTNAQLTLLESLRFGEPTETITERYSITAKGASLT